VKKIKDDKTQFPKVYITLVDLEVIHCTFDSKGHCTDSCYGSVAVRIVMRNCYPSIQKDTTFTKIFVGGLPYHTTDASLRKYFETFGDIDEAVVITDRQTGKSRGYGFVSTISCVSSVVAALAIANSQKLVKLNAKNNTLPLLGFTHSVQILLCTTFN